MVRNTNNSNQTKSDGRGKGGNGKAGGRQNQARRGRKGQGSPSQVAQDIQEGRIVSPPKYRKGSMRIVPLGGLGEIGRNMNVVEYNGHILLIDCGVLEAKCREHHIDPIMHPVSGRDKMKVGPFNLEFITVTHSIPDALAVSVKTPAGHLIDTGDMKLDQLPLDHKITELREFARLGEQGVDLLMADSTNAEVPGFVKPETSIGPALDKAFSDAKRKIIVASFSSHVHRVQQVVDTAHKYGRKVVFVGRSMVRNMGIAADLGYLHLPENTVVDLKESRDIQDDKLVYMCTGSQGEPMAALGRIADGNHPDIAINEFDTVILASSLIPGNEHEVYKVINKLARLGARVVNRDNAAIHVSGHSNEGELLYFYNIVQPKCAMPIHGENRHLIANGLIAVKTGVDPNNVILAEDGDVVDLYHGQAAIVGSVPCGYVYVDGDSVGEITEDELEKRRILSEEGFVSSFVVVDTDKKEVVSGPKIFINAMAEDVSDFQDVQSQIVTALNDAMLQGTTDTYQLQQKMRRTLGSWIGRTFRRRRPMVVPVVADLAKDLIPRNR